MDARSHPFLYYMSRHLFASGTLVIFWFSASYFKVRPVLNDTAFNSIASVICSASLKLPGYCWPVLHAFTKRDSAAAVLSSWLGFFSIDVAGISNFIPEMSFDSEY